MDYEKAQKGNPHLLTIKQHVFPTASIARFADDRECVSVYLCQEAKEVRLAPNNELFCAKRVWNQASEQGFMRNIEDSFQTLAERILDGCRDIKDEEKKFVSQFYELWISRAESRLSPQPDLTSSALSERKLSKDEEEILEKNGYAFSRGATVPGRHISSIRIQASIGRRCPPETTWAIVHSRNIEFLVPDSFGEIGIVPLAPNLCLVSNASSGEVSDANAISINKIAVAKATSYYFARDFTKCGL